MYQLEKELTTKELKAIWNTIRAKAVEGTLSDDDFVPLSGGSCRGKYYYSVGEFKKHVDIKETFNSIYLNSFYSNYYMLYRLFLYDSEELNKHDHSIYRILARQYLTIPSWERRRHNEFRDLVDDLSFIMSKQNNKEWEQMKQAQSYDNTLKSKNSKEIEEEPENMEK